MLAKTHQSYSKGAQVQVKTRSNPPREVDVAKIWAGSGLLGLFLADILAQTWQTGEQENMGYVGQMNVSSVGQTSATAISIFGFPSVHREQRALLLSSSCKGTILSETVLLLLDSTVFLQP